MIAVLSEVHAETQRQVQLWGVQDHDPFRYLSILTEEVGEAAQAINDAEFKGQTAAHIEKARTELIQVAAVAASFVEAIDRGCWLGMGNYYNARKGAENEKRNESGNATADDPRAGCDRSDAFGLG